MEEKTISRWKEDFTAFSKAFLLLEKFVEKGRDFNGLEVQGLIKAFEYNFDLSVKLIGDYYEMNRETEIPRSRDAFRQALDRGLIVGEERWMNMAENRNRTGLAYQEEFAMELAYVILSGYVILFQDLHKTMLTLSMGQRDLFHAAG